MNITKIIKIATVLFMSAAFLAAGCSGGSGTASITTSNSSPSAPTSSLTSQSPNTIHPTSFSSPPAMQVDTSKTYVATVDTSLGSFKIQLFASESPKTVNNFVFLSKEGFYNGVIFHRIIKTFMVQTGDPTGTGGGGPGYKFPDELPVKHKYDVGIVAMANAGANTNGSQFFICTGPDAAGLNQHPNYAQFGQVIEGMDVVQKIAQVDVTINPATGENSKPVNPPVINKITITQS